MDAMTFQVPTSGIPQLTVPMISRYKIPVPPLAVQQHIVTILDRFDALCSAPVSGLPAEIAARQKQYEYYRNKLLAFQERTARSISASSDHGRHGGNRTGAAQDPLRPLFERS